jgi:hypothetical protein
MKKITDLIIKLEGSLENHQRAVERLESLGYICGTPQENINLLRFHDGAWLGISHLLSEDRITVDEFLDMKFNPVFMEFDDKETIHFVDIGGGKFKRYEKDGKYEWFYGRNLNEKIESERILNRLEKEFQEVTRAKKLNRTVK